MPSRAQSPRRASPSRTVSMRMHREWQTRQQQLARGVADIGIGTKQMQKHSCTRLCLARELAELSDEKPGGEDEHRQIRALRGRHALLKACNAV